MLHTERVSPSDRIPSSLARVNRDDDPVPQEVREEVDVLFELAGRLPVLDKGPLNIMRRLLVESENDPNKFREGLRKVIDFLKKVEAVLEESRNPEVVLKQIRRQLEIKKEQPTIH